MAKMDGILAVIVAFMASIHKAKQGTQYGHVVHGLIDKAIFTKNGKAIKMSLHDVIRLAYGLRDDDKAGLIKAVNDLTKSGKILKHDSKPLYWLPQYQQAAKAKAAAVKISLDDLKSALLK